MFSQGCKKPTKSCNHYRSGETRWHHRINLFLVELDLNITTEFRNFCNLSQESQALRVLDNLMSFHSCSYLSNPIRMEQQ